MDFCQIKATMKPQVCMYWLRIICGIREGRVGEREREALYRISGSLSLPEKKCSVKTRQRKNESEKCLAKQPVTDLLCDFGQQKECSFSLNSQSYILPIELLLLRDSSNLFTSLLSSSLRNAN